MKRIIVDITSFLGTDSLTGIQRVVIELTSLLIKNNNNIILIKTNENNKLFYRVDNNEFLKFANQKNRHKIINIIDSTLDIQTLGENDIFLDIDSSFDTRCISRFNIYSCLSKQQCKIITFIYDLLPCNRPEFWSTYQNNYLMYLAATLKFSNKIIVNTNAVKRQLLNLIDFCKFKKDIEVLPLGSNIKDSYDSNNVSNLVMNISNKKYLLIVCTIEPRKNHINLVKAYINNIVKKDINLVIVGRYGWDYEEIDKEIKKSKLLNKRIFIINNANNDEVVFLYKHAFAFVFPSHDEGYGLPIVEALFYNIPVFSSNLDIFKEISNDLVVTFDQNEPDDISSVISKYIDNPKEYNMLKTKIKIFKPYSWEYSYNKLIKILNDI